ncbi:hypothetical protein DPEC_G00343590 [Dallia pectoralis]|uniref:Uncharacterized protein n=1 Tax=Dallia pectoralis TaxID=75939 RepID=A0ACC2F317_DALPE|nr:hypothetical protein DPEC_G00343590 [Dallia pectoralis]
MSAGWTRPGIIIFPKQDAKLRKPRNCILVYSSLFKGLRRFRLAFSKYAEHVRGIGSLRTTEGAQDKRDGFPIT